MMRKRSPISGKQQRRLSAIPWLNHWLTKLNLAPVSSLYLYQAGVTLTLGTLVLTSIAGFAFLGYMLYWRFGSRASGAARLGRLSSAALSVRPAQAYKASIQAGTAIARGAGHDGQRSARGPQSDRQPGSGRPGICREPISGEIRKCFEEQNYGVDLRTALVNLTERAPIQDFRIFVAAVLIQKESGGNLAEVLEKVAQTTRERFRLKKQVSVHTAQGRMTGWVLSLLPVGLGLAMYFVNPDGMSVLWKRPIGLKLLCDSRRHGHCRRPHYSKDRSYSRLKGTLCSLLYSRSLRPSC